MHGPRRRGANRAEELVDYADALGTFGGTDWSIVNLWCAHDSGEMH